MGGEKLRIFLPRRLADISVGGRKILFDAVKVAFLSLKRDFAGRHDALIPVYQFVFFLHEFDVFFGKTVHAELDVFQEKLAVFRVDVPLEGRIQKREAERLHIGHRLGILHIDVFVLFLVKFIRSVHRVADACDGEHRGNAGGIFFLLLHTRLDLRIRRGIFHPFVESRIKFFEGFKIGTLIFQFPEGGKFFHCFLLMINRSNRN